MTGASDLRTDRLYRHRDLAPLKFADTGFRADRRTYRIPPGAKPDDSAR